jgi:hypothetical protein
MSDDLKETFKEISGAGRDSIELKDLSYIINHFKEKAHECLWFIYEGTDYYIVGGSSYKKPRYAIIDFGNSIINKPISMNRLSKRGLKRAIDELTIESIII